MRESVKGAGSLGDKIPLQQKDLTIVLLESGSKSLLPPGIKGTWNVTTDAKGAFEVAIDPTDLPQGPEPPLFVARSGTGDRSLYSAYLLATDAPQDVHLYPLTESDSTIRAEQRIVYDIHEADDVRSLRVRVRLSLRNIGGAMYVGKKAQSSHREVWRIPLPADAKILLNTSPYPGLPGWILSADARWLIVDTPIPGFPDLERQWDKHWEVEYLLPPRQRLVQVYPLPVRFEKEMFTVWCIHEDMSISSPALPSVDPSANRDPLTGASGAFDVAFSKEGINAGGGIPLNLTIDNAAIGQAISLRALWWVGGFVLVVLIALTLGLALGPKGPPPQALFESLGGEEVLDLIADLDGRFARGEIRERDYNRYREPLVELAAEEGADFQPGGAVGAGKAPALSSGVKKILARIAEIEEQGLDDPARIAERAHLLEALARELRSKASAG